LYLRDILFPAADLTDLNFPLPRFLDDTNRLFFFFILFILFSLNIDVNKNHFKVCQPKVEMWGLHYRTCYLMLIIVRENIDSPLF